MPYLNDSTIKSFPLPKGKNKLYFDTKIIGLGIRITNKNRKSFVLRYNMRGRERIYTIGGFPELTANAAREIALQIKANIARGIDPLEQKKILTEIPSFKEFVEEFLKVKSRFLRPSTLKSYRDYFFKKNLIPKFGNYRIDAITPRDLEIYHSTFIKKPRMGNRLIELMNLVFNAAIEWNIIDKNPAKSVKKFTEHRRERYLTQEEFNAVFEALKDEDEKNVNALKLILLTGSRKTEVLSARWQDFDLNNGVWIKPHILTKQKKTCHIPISQTVIEIIKNLKKEHKEYLFYNPTTQTHIKDLKKFWAKIQLKSGIAHATIHDLRHSFASALVNSDVPLEVIGKLLGHSNIKTTQNYAHLKNQRLREATELFIDKIVLKN